MKKIFALLLCVAMLASLAVSTSAAGEILFTDDFTHGFNPSSWIVEGNKFFLDEDSDPDNPALSAYRDGVICQMEFRDEVVSNPLRFTNCASAVRIKFRDQDGDDNHTVGLWWRDDFYHTPEGVEPPFENGEIWNVIVDCDNQVINLLVQGEEAPRASAALPAGAVEMCGEWFTLGWRIVHGRIQCYVNNQKLIEYSSEEISAEYPSPILFINGNNFSGWDDFVVATADYDLFGEGTVDVDPNPADTSAPAASDPAAGTTAPADVTAGGNNAPADTSVTTTATSVVEVTNDKGEAVTNEAGEKVTSAVVVTEAPAVTTTAVVQVTDEKGEAVTNAAGEQVTSVVTNAPSTAATNNNRPQGGNSTQTGDATFAVIAAMIVALGSAVVVKKTYVK